MMPDEVTAQCPYCGEWVELDVDALGPSSESYVEDCSVCCRPWQVTVHRGEGEVSVQLQREDE